MTQVIILLLRNVWRQFVWARHNIGEEYTGANRCAFAASPERAASFLVFSAERAFVIDCGWLDRLG
jgi:hypothetical protein